MTAPMTNVPFDRLEVGMQASQTRVCLWDDLYVFANASGNLNPMHLPKEDGDGDGAPEAVAPGMWVASLISGVLGCKLPGPGTLYHAQTLRFVGRSPGISRVFAARPSRGRRGARPSPSPSRPIPARRPGRSTASPRAASSAASCWRSRSA